MGLMQSVVGNSILFQVWRKLNSSPTPDYNSFQTNSSAFSNSYRGDYSSVDISDGNVCLYDKERILAQYVTFSNLS